MQTAHNFGELLYYLRVNYSRRVSKLGEPLTKRKRTQAELIWCMEQEGYTISEGAYSDIEAGKSFPRDAEGFLSAIAQCLVLNDEEREQLNKQLAYDILAARVSLDFARKYIYGL